MNYRVLVTSQAHQQLAEIAVWWAQHRSSEQAIRWADGFEEAIAALAENPEGHPVAREDSQYDLPFMVRQLLYEQPIRAAASVGQRLSCLAHLIERADFLRGQRPIENRDFVNRPGKKTRRAKLVLAGRTDTCGLLANRTAIKVKNAFDSGGGAGCLVYC